MENENDIVKSVEEPSSVKPPMVNASNLASKSVRFTNFILDSILVWVIAFCIQYLLYSIGYGAIFEIKDNPLLELLIRLYYPLILFLYYFTFEGLYQRTPAKYFTKTIVVYRDGTKPSISSICGRSLARLIPFEQFTFLKKDGLGLHDSTSKTFVIFKF
jgi:uncharacterized RDD family membrane protein YckC